MIFARQLRRAALAVSTVAAVADAQTWTSCNPLASSGCPADTALGMAINVDFAKGSVNSFTATGGNPTYGPDGVTLTVGKGGDAPQLTSVFYIMFGRVEFTMKCAPGSGIVSSLVLQSDDLDEVDMEWLGADSGQVQTNYFGKGQTGNYDRGQFNPAANNQGDFITYTIDWTADRIVWSVGQTVVRTLAYNDAKGQYPQTPMQVKFGAWSGGDPANSQGTIAWAHGPTDYSNGPFSMTVRSVNVADYSTGKQYKYGDQSGTWQSIQAVDGKVNANVGKAPSQTTYETAAAANSLSPSVPVGGIGRGDSTSTARPTVSPVDAIPSGWVMTSEGKIVPNSSTADRPIPSSSPCQSACASLADGSGGEQFITTVDGHGSATTMTMHVGATAAPGMAAEAANHAAGGVAHMPRWLWLQGALMLALTLRHLA